MRIETAEPVETEEEVLIEDRTAGQDGLETTLTILRAGGMLHTPFNTKTGPPLGGR